MVDVRIHDLIVYLRCSTDIITSIWDDTSRDSHVAYRTSVRSRRFL